MHAFANQFSRLLCLLIFSAIPLQDPNLAQNLPESNSTTAKSLATSNGVGTSSNTTSVSSSNGSQANTSAMESACSNSDCIPSSSGVITQCPIPQNGVGNYVSGRTTGKLIIIG